MNKGYIYAFVAYFMWGFFPVYWKLIKNVPSVEISLHRIIWSFVFYTLVLGFYYKKWKFFIPKTKEQFKFLSLASVLLLTNWFLYIFAVNSNQIVESSLGYFINPFVNFLFGILIFKEQISKTNIFIILFAALGVIIIGWDLGRWPWIAIVLAVTFSLYGVLKKKSESTGLQSSQFEAMIFTPLALGYLMFSPNTNSWLSTDLSTQTALLLVGGGVITGLPLIFFAEATQKVPYYVMGFFQFIAPTLQFLSGVMIFHEPISYKKLIGFVIIWLAMVSFAFHGFLKRRKN